MNNSKKEYQLRLSNVVKTFQRDNGELVHAVDDVTLNVEAGEFIVLLGPSGCGKTTLLRCVAGLEHPSEGTISIGGENVFSTENKLNTPPERRHIGMVFQSYALWPHMTVAQNVGYPLKMRGVPRAEIQQRATEILELMRISNLGDQYPGQISGGQQQRVALARALVRGDKLVLFDEPLSNVDAKVREHLRLELMSMQRELGFTALYVTHDQEEAMSLATRVAVISDGKIDQIGTPQEVYLTPSSLSVARFIGSVNQFNGKRAESSDEIIKVETGLGSLSLPRSVFSRASGQNVSLISRPEKWEISSSKTEGRLCWPGTVRAAAFAGSHNQYLVDLETNHELQVWQQGGALIPIGTKVWCTTNETAFLAYDQVDEQ